MNLNNILFPSVKDMQRVLEFLVEYITQFDIGIQEDFGPNFNEKNYVRIKFANNLTSWSKSPWIMPELTNKPTSIPISSILSVDTKQLNAILAKKDKSIYF